MKTSFPTTPESIPNFPGIVRDIATGRLCASLMDCARGLNLHHELVRRAARRKYQFGSSELVDVEDVVINRGKTLPPGRPRKHRHRGIIITELMAVIASSVAGVALAVGIISSIGDATAPILSEAVSHQERNVQMMEDLGFSGAAEARKQWEASKAVANARIADLKTLNLSEQ